VQGDRAAAAVLAPSAAPRRVTIRSSHVP